MADAGFRAEIRELIDLWWPEFAARVDDANAEDPIRLTAAPLVEAGDEYRRLLKDAFHRFTETREEWARQRDALLDTMKAGVAPAKETHDDH